MQAAQSDHGDDLASEPESMCCNIREVGVNLGEGIQFCDFLRGVYPLDYGNLVDFRHL